MKITAYITNISQLSVIPIEYKGQSNIEWYSVHAGTGVVISDQDMQTQLLRTTVNYPNNGRLTQASFIVGIEHLSLLGKIKIIM